MTSELLFLHANIWMFSNKIYCIFGIDLLRSKPFTICSTLLYRWISTYTTGCIFDPATEIPHPEGKWLTQHLLQLALRYRSSLPQTVININSKIKFRGKMLTANKNTYKRDSKNGEVRALKKISV